MMVVPAQVASHKSNETAQNKQRRYRENASAQHEYPGLNWGGTLVPTGRQP
jgi:hypothetical protein